MNEVTAASFLSSLSRVDKLCLLSRLSYDLTVVARGLYDEADGVSAPKTLRTLNEVQHSLTGILARCLADETDEIPDSYIATIFFGERLDNAVTRALSACFERAVTRGRWRSVDDVGGVKVSGTDSRIGS